MAADPLKKAVAEVVFHGVRNQHIIRPTLDGPAVAYEVHEITDTEIIVRVVPARVGGPRYFKVKLSEMM